MTSTGKSNGKKDSRRGIALSEDTIERIRRVMAAAVLSGEKVYPQTVSAFISAATEEKLTRDLGKFGVDRPPRR